MPPNAPNAPVPPTAPKAPAPPTAYSQLQPPLETVPVPDGLPDPVARYYAAISDGAVPRFDTAVISGRGTMSLNGLTLPMRGRLVHGVPVVEATMIALAVLAGVATMAIMRVTVDREGLRSQAEALSVDASMNIVDLVNLPGVLTEGQGPEDAEPIKDRVLAAVDPPAVQVDG